MVDSTGSSVVTLRVNAGAAAAGQTLRTFAGTVSVAAGATVALETVAAGKSLYLTDIYIGSNTGTVFSVSITAGGTAIFSGFCKGDTGPIVIPGIETQPQAGAGTAVVLNLGTAAGTTCAYFLSGFEQ